MFRDKTFNCFATKHVKDVRSGQPLFCNQPPRGSTNKPEIARVSQRESEWARGSQSEPEKARVIQGVPEWARESQSEPERVWVSLIEPHRESQRATENLSGSPWLALVHSGSLPGSLWLSRAHPGSLRNAAQLSLALTGSLRLSLAFSGSLWLSIALRICVQSPCLAHKQGPCSARSVATALQHFIQPWPSPSPPPSWWSCRGRDLEADPERILPHLEILTALRWFSLCSHWVPGGFLDFLSFSVMPWPQIWAQTGAGEEKRPFLGWSSSSSLSGHQLWLIIFTHMSLTSYWSLTALLYNLWVYFFW